MSCVCNRVIGQSVFFVSLEKVVISGDVIQVVVVQTGHDEGFRVARLLNFAHRTLVNHHRLPLHSRRVLQFLVLVASRRVHWVYLRLLFTR